jgi:hypothetical protein
MVLRNNPNLHFLSTDHIVTTAFAPLPESHRGLTTVEAMLLDPTGFDNKPWNTITCLSVSSFAFDMPILPQLLSLKFTVQEAGNTLPEIFETLQQVCENTPKLRFLHALIGSHYTPFPGFEVCPTQDNQELTESNPTLFSENTCGCRSLDELEIPSDLRLGCAEGRTRSE